MGDPCDCCGDVTDLPYHHDNHNPPYGGYDYCQACYDWGCGGPGDCALPERQSPDLDAEMLEAEVQTAIRSIQEAQGGSQ